MSAPTRHRGYHSDYALRPLGPCRESWRVRIDCPTDQRRSLSPRPEKGPETRPFAAHAKNTIGFKKSGFSSSLIGQRCRLGQRNCAGEPSGGCVGMLGKYQKYRARNIHRPSSTQEVLQTTAYPPYNIIFQFLIRQHFGAQED